ncbi:MAG: hypothetical protein ACUX7D_07335 [Candidatus Methanodesulfokora washburnensis]|jgi:hypothetical protein
MFDIRGGVTGASATYYRLVSNNISVLASVSVARVEGGYLNATGKIVYATDSFIVFYDIPRGNTFLIGQDFTNPAVSAIPVRITYRVSEDDGFRKFFIRIPDGDAGNMLSMARAACNSIKTLEKACYLTGIIDVWYKSNSSVASSLINSLAVKDIQGIFDIETVGNEITLKIRSASLDGVVMFLSDLNKILAQQGIEVRGIYAVETSEIIIERGVGSNDAISVIRNLGLEVVGVQERC